MTDRVWLNCPRCFAWVTLGDAERIDAHRQVEPPYRVCSASGRTVAEYEELEEVLE